MLLPTSLLHTCRRLYFEVKPLLYSTARIVSRDPAIAIFLARNAPASGFDSMRIDLHWNNIDATDRRRKIGAYRQQRAVWRQVWCAISKLKGASVMVSFRQPRYRWYGWWGHGEEAISIIDEVGPWQVKSLEVRVNWPETEPPRTQAFADSYFRVVARKEEISQ